MITHKRPKMKTPSIYKGITKLIRKALHPFRILSASLPHLFRVKSASVPHFVRILSASLPHKFRVSSASPTGLDKSKENLYTTSQVSGTFFERVRAFFQTKLGNFSNQRSTYGYKEQLVMKTRNISHGQLAVFAFTLVAAATLLSACGGGGGSSPTNPPPPVTPTATLALKSATPANGATGVAAKGVATVVVSYQNTGTFTQTLDVKCNSVSARTGVTESLDPLKGELTYTVNYTAPNLTICSISGNVSGKGTGGATDPATVSVNNTFTTEAAVAAFWPPKNLTPMGVKVLGTEFSQLPAGCTSVYATPFTPSSGFSVCWKDFVTANKMKWVQTSRTMVGTTPIAQATRPIVFAAFITLTGRHQVMTMYADTGELINQGEIINEGQVSPLGIDFMFGNDQGYIFREKTSSICYQWRWNPPTTVAGVSSNVWDFASVTCPL